MNKGASFIILIPLMLILYMLATTSFDSYSQFQTWKGQMSAMHINESLNIEKNKNYFDRAVTKTYYVFTGSAFAKTCEEGNANAQAVKKFGSNKNYLMDDHPVLVRINLDFGCKNMDYNPQTHETTYAGKIVRFYVPQARDLPLFQ